MEDAHHLEWSARGLTLVCIVPSSLPGETEARWIERLENAAQALRIPVIVHGSDLSAAVVVGLRDPRARHLLVEGIDHQDFATTFRDVAVRPVFEHVQAVIRARFAKHPILKRVLAETAGQVPPPASVALEEATSLAVASRQRRSVGFRRRVHDLSIVTGTSLSYLEELARSEGFFLWEFMRRNTILHGMALYNGRSSRDVAYRLGFQTADAWRMLVRRDLETGLRDLRDLSLGTFAQRLLELVE